jgi:hypothetical protein
MLGKQLEILLSEHHTHQVPVSWTLATSLILSRTNSIEPRAQEWDGLT